MNNQKILDIINEINTEAAEREELVECIAIALLTRKNLFILGDTGQAKSYCINLFRKRITGAKQFERLMSKQTDDEQLFGRLDLSSLIPGNMPHDSLMQHPEYASLHNKVKETFEQYGIDGERETLKKAADYTTQLEAVKRIICHLTGNLPTVISDGKIPDSDIVFLDEIFKANDGILNSLLTALNEKVYTNEGNTISIPVISFFSASNEIPDFSDPAEQILKPLYDRFELKVLTSYVDDKQNRMNILSRKQSKQDGVINATITLDELRQMQREVSAVRIPEQINDLADSVLLELRKAGIHVSDRKFFAYYPIVQAKAFLRGATEVNSKDLLVLKNYFWNKPDEIEKVAKILTDFCENPIGTEVARILDMGYEAKRTFDEEYAGDPNNFRPYVKFSSEIFRIYMMLDNIRKDNMPDSDIAEIKRGEDELERLSVEADQTVETDHVTLYNKKRLSA